MTLPAIIFVFFVLVVALFQLALAVGMPWGKLAMGGRFPGKFPPVMRGLSVVQTLILIMLGVIVLTKAKVILPEWHFASKTAIWVVVAFSTLATILNLITPSKWERRIWAPVAAVLMVCSLLVALG